MPKKEPAKKKPPAGGIVPSSPNLWLLGAATGGAAAAGWIASSLLSRQRQPPHTDEKERELSAAIEKLERRLAHTATSNEIERGELERQILQLQEELAGMDEVQNGMQQLLQTVEDLSGKLAEKRPWNAMDPIDNPFIEEHVSRILNGKMSEQIDRLKESVAREREEWTRYAGETEERMCEMREKNQMMARECEEARKVRMQQDALEARMRAIDAEVAATEEECEKRLQSMAALQAEQVSALEEARAFDMKDLVSRCALLEHQAAEAESLRVENASLRQQLNECGVARGMEAARLAELEAENADWRRRWEQEAEPLAARNASLRTELDAYRAVEGQEDDMRLARVRTMVAKMRRLVPQGSLMSFDSEKTELIDLITRVCAGQKQALRTTKALNQELETTRSQFKVFRKNNMTLMTGYRQAVERVAYAFVEALFEREHPGSTDKASLKRSYTDQFMNPLAEQLNELVVPS